MESVTIHSMHYIKRKKVKKPSATSNVKQCAELGLMQTSSDLCPPSTNLLDDDHHPFRSHVVEMKDESPVEVALSVQRTVMYVRLLLVVLSTQPTARVISLMIRYMIDQFVFLSFLAILVNFWFLMSFLCQ